MGLWSAQAFIEFCSSNSNRTLLYPCQHPTTTAGNSESSSLGISAAGTLSPKISTNPQRLFALTCLQFAGLSDGGSGPKSFGLFRPPFFRPPFFALADRASLCDSVLALPPSEPSATAAGFFGLGLSITDDFEVVPQNHGSFDCHRFCYWPPGAELLGGDFQAGGGEVTSVNSGEDLVG